MTTSSRGAKVKSAAATEAAFGSHTTLPGLIALVAAFFWGRTETNLELCWTNRSTFHGLRLLEGEADLAASANRAEEDGGAGAVPDGAGSRGAANARAHATTRAARRRRKDRGGAEAATEAAAGATRRGRRGITIMVMRVAISRTQLEGGKAAGQ
jgi:hypothetical protein